MASKWKKELSKLSGYIPNEDRESIHRQVLRTGSPGVDFTFGNGWGLPLGYTQCIFGPPKGGKSLYSYAMISQMHRDYEDAEAIKFDTEYRDEGQLTQKQAAAYGIDWDRYTAIQTNTAEGVFDQIETKIAAMCDDGFPLKLVIIDSINGIMGRRMSNADSVGQQLIGDVAQTLQDGFKRILRVQRKYRFGVLLTAQVRAEMDMAEQQRGNKVKMAAAFGVQHYAEYFTFVERMKAKAAQKDLLGREFIDESVTDFMDNGERTGHKIRVVMKDSSLGPAGRAGEMTFNYNQGLVNRQDEIFILGTGHNVIESSGTWYSFGDRKLQKAAFLEALQTDPDFANAILKKLRERDLSLTNG